MRDGGQTMRVKVLVFASYADALGTGALELELPAGSTAAACVAEFRRRAGEGVLPSALLAVNRRYADPAQPLSDGDEVALITPVAGG
jgi:molybdopterin converting factor small subunit